MAAAARRRVAVVRLLLKHGVRVDLRDGQGKTALMHAAHAGLSDSVTLLLEAGGNESVSAPDMNGETALHFAAQRGHLDVTNLLVDAGGDVDVRSQFCASPLHLAISGCQGEGAQVARALLAAGAQPGPAADWAGTAAPNAAQPPQPPPRNRKCEGEGLPAVPELPPPGSRILTCDTTLASIDLPVMRLYGMLYDRPKPLLPPGSPLDADADASEEGAEARRSLAKAGGRVRRVLEVLANAPRGSHPPSLLVHWLRSRHEQAGPALESGQNALQLAATLGSARAVKRLLAAGASPDVRAVRDGATALYLASALGHDEVVSLLLNANASLHIVEWNTGCNPLHAASWHGHANVVRLLLEAGGADSIDVATQVAGATSFTPLMLASWSGHSDVVRELLRAQASTSPRWQDLSAIDLARQAEGIDLSAGPGRMSPSAQRVFRVLEAPRGKSHAKVQRLLVKLSGPALRGAREAELDGADAEQPTVRIAADAGVAQDLPWPTDLGVAPTLLIAACVAAMVWGRGWRQSSASRKPSPPPKSPSRAAAPKPPSASAAGRGAFKPRAKAAPSHIECSSRGSSPLDPSLGSEAAARGTKAEGGQAPNAGASHSAAPLSVPSGSPHYISATHAEFWQGFAPQRLKGSHSRREGGDEPSGCAAGQERCFTLPRSVGGDEANGTPWHARPASAGAGGSEDPTGPEAVHAEVRGGLREMGFTDAAARAAVSVTSASQRLEGLSRETVVQTLLDASIEWLDAQARNAACSSLRPEAAAFELGGPVLAERSSEC